MDERAMMDLTAMPLLLTVPAAFAGGLALGLLYFRALQATTELIVGDGSATLAFALTAGRVALLGAGFWLASQSGGAALLAALAGVLCAKALMLRRVQGGGGA
jgi:hypothetical protein